MIWMNSFLIASNRPMVSDLRVSVNSTWKSGDCYGSARRTSSRANFQHFHHPAAHAHQNRAIERIAHPHAIGGVGGIERVDARDQLFRRVDHFAVAVIRNDAD